MDIHAIVKLSGLSRDQINQLVSRYGVVVRGRSDPGSARRFTPSDAFALIVAGMLYRIGFTMIGIRDALAMMPMPVLDEHGWPAEYPGSASGGKKSYLILAFDDDRGESREFSSLEGADAWINGRPSLVVSLSPIAERIKAATAGI
jgi:DNA-binding transcriptional MerR regulator